MGRPIKSLGLVTTLVFFLVAFGQEEQLQKFVEGFITVAAEGSLYEIQSSELALENASSDAVRKFARTMINDHTRIIEQLNQVATQLGVTPPSETGAAQQLMIVHLSGLQGAVFDQTYLMQQVRAHEMEVDLYNIAVQDAQDEQLVAFAQETLPLLRSHLQAAQELRQQDTVEGGDPPPPEMDNISWQASTLRELYDPQGNRFAYAPSTIADGDALRIWTCHNDQDGVIKDHIYYTVIESGQVVESRSVLQGGSQGSWDSFHVCDPTVIKGEFMFEGITYNYAMFYLGNDVDASYHNQIGVAFAEDIAGPWTKYPNPIITYPRDGRWGVGQPSATSIDGKGHLLLFYTKGGTSTQAFRRELDLSNMNSPLIQPEVLITILGLTGTEGSSDHLNNFDVAYDPSRDRFYAVREQHPYPSDFPTFIGPAVQIVSIPGANVWGGGGEWQVEGAINENLTCYPRNHNAGLVRTEYGTLPTPEELTVVFTTSCAESSSVRCTWPNVLWTYDLWEITGQLP